MMKLQKDTKRLQRLFRERKAVFRMIALLTATTLLIVLLLSALLYSAFRRIELQRGRASAENSFVQLTSVVDAVSVNAQGVGLQVMLDELCSELLMAGRPEMADTILLGRASRQLSLYSYIHSYIDSIYIYNRHAGVVATDTFYSRLSEGAFNDPDAVEMMDHYGDYEHAMPVRRVIERDHFGSLINRPVYTFVYPWFSHTSELDCAVVVNLSQQWLTDALHALPDLNKSSLRVMGGPDNLMVDFSKDSAFDWDDPAFAPEMGDEGIVTLKEYTQYGYRYVVTTLRVGAWDYVRVTDWEAVFPGVGAIRRAAVWIVCLVLLAAALLCLANGLSAWRMYAKMDERNRELASDQRLHLQHARSALLFDLITGGTLRYAQLDKKLQDYGLALHSGQPVSLLALKIVGHQQLVDEADPDDLYLYRYGVCNILEELAAPHFACAGIQAGNENLYFILGKKLEAPAELDALNAILTDFSQKVTQLVPWRFFAVSAGYWTTLDSLGPVKQELDRCLPDSIFYPAFSHLILSEAQARRGPAPEYPQEAERRILDALRSGNTDEVERQYGRFEADVAGRGYTDYMAAVSMLAFKVTALAAELGDSGAQAPNYGDFLLEVRAAQSTGEVGALFAGLFESVQALAEQGRRKQSVAHRLQMVDEFIQQHYRDSNLTPGVLADRLHLSPAYLAKLFKKNRRISLSEHINLVRIEQVAARLTTTDLPAREIALDCGFTNPNYFYTLFKKIYGYTPQTYRTRMRAAPNGNEDGGVHPES